ncbi:MAG: hypothetical protein ACLSAH_14170 [Bilophila wadsworthia]
MTPGQTHPRRRGLNELMESVAAKLAERPDHIAAARVLEEMQADAAKISHKADGVDVHNGQPEVSSSSSSSSSPLWTRKLILLSVLPKWTIRTDLQVDSPRRYDLASL